MISTNPYIFNLNTDKYTHFELIVGFILFIYFRDKCRRLGKGFYEKREINDAYAYYSTYKTHYIDPAFMSHTVLAYQYVNWADVGNISKVKSELAGSNFKYKLRTSKLKKLFILILEIFIELDKSMYSEYLDVANNLIIEFTPAKANDLSKVRSMISKLPIGYQQFPRSNRVYDMTEIRNAIQKRDLGTILSIFSDLSCEY